MAGADAGHVVEAVRRLVAGGRQVVVQRSSVGLEPHASLHLAGAVDHRALFPRAAVVVHHGGAGTTHAACAAGVPSVVVPHVGDQPYWADRLHRLGVAPRPITVRRLSADRLAGAAASIADDVGARQNAETLAERLAGEDGVGVAIRALEDAAG